MCNVSILVEFSPADAELARAKIVANSEIDPETGCWIWTKSRVNGYGRTRPPGLGRQTVAHRASFAAFVGAANAGMDVGHICHNRACVNPEHLKVMTRMVNNRMKPLCLDKRTHCLHGHTLEEVGVYEYFDKRGGMKRECKECRAERSRRWNADRSQRRRLQREAS